MMTGTVTKKIFAKGFCFVLDEHGMSRFAHAKEFIPTVAFDTLHEGALVEFTPTGEATDDKNNLRCVQVRVVKTL